MLYLSDKKLLSYYELRKMIDASKCVFNDDILNYFELLLLLDVSVLYKNQIDDVSINYLKQLDLFRNLAVYNMYYKFLGLIDDNKKYIISDDKINSLNIGICIKNYNYNIFSFDYKKDISNVYFNGYNNTDLLSKVNNDYLQFYENNCLLSSERNQLLEKFLFQNNLSLSDFYDEKKLDGGKQKIKKYGFTNIIIR